VLDKLETYIRKNITKGVSDQWDSGYNTGLGDVFNQIKQLRQQPPAQSADAVLEFKPDWVSSPGDTIRDIMAEKGISRFKLGRMLKVSEKSVLGLMFGSFPIDNDMANKLSESLGSSVEFWEERERIYREQLRQSQQHPNGKQDGEQG